MPLATWRVGRVSTLTNPVHQGGRRLKFPCHRRPRRPSMSRRSRSCGSRRLAATTPAHAAAARNTKSVAPNHEHGSGRSALSQPWLQCSALPAKLRTAQSRVDLNPCQDLPVEKIHFGTSAGDGKMNISKGTCGDSVAGLSGAASNVRGHYDIWQLAQIFAGGLRTVRLPFEHIEGCTTYAAGRQPIIQCALVHQAPPSRVDEETARGQAFKTRAVQEVTRFTCCWKMQAHEQGPFDRLGKIRDDLLEPKFVAEHL